MSNKSPTTGHTKKSSLPHWSKQHQTATSKTPQQGITINPTTIIQQGYKQAKQTSNNNKHKDPTTGLIQNRKNQQQSSQKNPTSRPQVMQNIWPKI
jgi:hypothetical protein